MKNYKKTLQNALSIVMLKKIQKQIQMQFDIITTCLTNFDEESSQNICVSILYKIEKLNNVRQLRDYNDCQIYITKIELIIKTFQQIEPKIIETMINNEGNQELASNISTLKESMDELSILLSDKC